MVLSDKAKIRHTVVFTLKYPKDSAEEQDFLTAAKKLAAIPGLEKFECLKQISPKNTFNFGLSMEFADEHSYQAYTNHPRHQAFVKMASAGSRIYGNRLPGNPIIKFLQISLKCGLDERKKLLQYLIY